MSIYESAFHTTLRVHAFIYEHTDGLIGHRVLGVPCLMLRTTGRKTGQTRTNSLVYAEDGGRYLVVASKGGSPKGPGLAAEPPREAGGAGPDRPHAIPGDRHRDQARRPGLRPSVEARQRQQRQPVRRLPIEDHAADPGRRPAPDDLRAIAEAAVTSRSAGAMGKLGARRTTGSSPFRSSVYRQSGDQSSRHRGRPPAAASRLKQSRPRRGC